VPQWNNPRLRLFHGTDSRSVAPLPAVGNAFPAFAVNLAICRPFTDFGQGFYTTTRLHQARQWANTRVLRAPSRPGLFAIVMRLDLDRDWLASLDILAFVRPIRDFWSLVTDSRNGFPPHQRLPPAPTPYDVVYGPVTLWPQTLLISDCDQISFHTQRAAAGLNNPHLHATANNQPAGLFPP
jgi:Protein of unknown function (DUF3990)